MCGTVRNVNCIRLGFMKSNKWIKRSLRDMYKHMYDRCMSNDEASMRIVRKKFKAFEDAMIK